MFLFFIIKILVDYLKTNMILSLYMIIKGKQMKAVLDLECTCDEPQFPRNEMEIIEIGAVIIDDNFNIIDKFDVFVKPTIHTQLSEFCTHLTSITQDQVDNGLNFEEALTALQDFFVKYNVETWYSWGFFDNNKIKHQIRDHNLNEEKFSKFRTIKYENFSDTFFKKMGFKKKKGVSKALAICKLEFEGRKHLAIDDAINISRIIKHVSNIK